MKIKHLFCGALVLIQSLAFGQPSPEPYANLITPENLRENLEIIASDALEGRATGSRGQKMAAAFLRHTFQEFGLEGPVAGDYYQYFTLYRSTPGEVFIEAGGTQLKNFKDIIYYGQSNTDGVISTSAVFAGRGRPADFEKIDVEGKAVVILAADGQDYREGVSLARSKKAAAVMVVPTTSPEEFGNYAEQFRAYLSNGQLSLEEPEPQSGNGGVFFLSPQAAEKILGTTLSKLSEAAGSDAKRALKRIEGKISYKTTYTFETVEAENVLGYLEGTDKKDEVIVITAHYDHIGKLTEGEGDLINNGADDNGSGTVAVIEMARAFAQAKEDGNGPRRSILFLAVSGEENGLLGSEYYSENPIFPLAQTMVNLNIDMIGRRDPEHSDSDPYVYVIGSDKLSSELHEVSEAVNKKYANLIFDYTYNDENHPLRLYYRSDHWNFARKNIPIIFYFDGLHEDYHKPSDEVDKIEFDLLTIRTKCVFYTAWELANRERSIEPDKK